MNKEDVKSRSKRSVDAITPTSATAGNIFTTLEKRIVSQENLNDFGSLTSNNPWAKFYSPEQVINGIKEFHISGLVESYYFDKYGKDVDLNRDFNPARPVAKSFSVETNIRRGVVYPVDNSAVLNQFTKPEVRETFVAGIIAGANARLVVDLKKDQAKWLLGENVSYTNPAGSTVNIDALPLDKDITVKDGSEANILDDIVLINKTIKGLEVPIKANSANSHVKLTGVSSGDKAKYEFAYGRNDFYLVFDIDYWHSIKKVNAKLFKNIEDLFLINRDNIIIEDFGAWGSQDAKIKGFLIHKKALREPYFVKRSETYSAPQFKVIYRKELEHTFYKLPTKPVYRFKTA